MKRERDLLARILLWATQQGWRLFRNDSGQAYVGKVIFERRRNGGYVVTIARAKRIKYGLAPGSSDHIGWRPVLITPDMVGGRIAQFCAIEAKTKNDRLSKRQRNFLREVQKAGGYAAVVREGEGGLEFHDEDGAK